MAKQSGQVTQKQFEFFKRECKRWLDVLGLYNWEVRYFLKPMDDGYAEVSFNHDGRMADVFLCEDWGSFRVSVPTTAELRKTALHEVLEILLYPLRYIAECRYVLGVEEIDCACHNVIRVLEHVLAAKK